jgi:DNA-binding transcriptional LysR family regulator
MVPTALAQQMVESIEQGLRHLTLALDRAERFEPASSDRAFRIAINDIGQLILMPALIGAVRAEAPRVRIETVDAGDAQSARVLLAEGKVDLAIGSWEDMGADFYRQELFRETFVALVSRAGTEFDDPMSMEQYLAAEHVTYRPSGRSDAALQAHLDQVPELGRRRVALTMAHSLGVPSIVASSSLVLSAQSRLAEALVQSRDDLHWVRLPFEVPPFPVRQQWHARRHADNGHRWLRQLSYRLFLDLPMPQRLCA